MNSIRNLIILQIILSACAAGVELIHLSRVPFLISLGFSGLPGTIGLVSPLVLGISLFLIMQPLPLLYISMILHRSHQTEFQQQFTPVVVLLLSYGLLSMLATAISLFVTNLFVVRIVVGNYTIVSFVLLMALFVMSLRVLPNTVSEVRSRQIFMASFLIYPLLRLVLPSLLLTVFIIYTQVPMEPETLIRGINGISLLLVSVFHFVLIYATYLFLKIPYYYLSDQTPSTLQQPPTIQ